MYRADIIKSLLNYFSIEELVCPHCFSAHGTFSFNFLSTPALSNLLTIRSQIIKSAMYINSYHSGGSLSQRGLRCNICELVSQKTLKNALYLSAHIFGCAFDFDSLMYSAETCRRMIIANSNLLPFPLRLEHGSGWVHFDTFNYENDARVIQFSSET